MRSNLRAGLLSIFVYCICFALVRAFYFGQVLVFLFWDFMLKFLECLFDIAVHTNADFSFDVVPVQMHTDVLFCVLINFEWIFFMSVSNKVINILFLVYLIPNSLKPRANEMSRVSCKNSPSLYGAFLYPNLSRCWTRLS